MRTITVEAKMSRLAFLACIGIFLVYINQVSGEDVFLEMSKRATDLKVKLTKALPSKPDTKDVRKVQAELKRFADNFKIVQDKAWQGVAALSGPAQKNARKAAEGLDEASQELIQTLNRAEKNARTGNNAGFVDQLITGTRGSISYAGEGIKDFLSSIKGAGPKAIDIGIDVTTAFERVGDILFQTLVQMG